MTSAESYLELVGPLEDVGVEDGEPVGGEVEELEFREEREEPEREAAQAVAGEVELSQGSALIEREGKVRDGVVGHKLI